jgi:hypothetical protein
MTDEIRITRRVALPDKYEFYEIQWTSNEKTFAKMVDEMETFVEFIREYCKKPKPEISPRREQYSFEEQERREQISPKINEKAHDMEKAWEEEDQYTRNGDADRRC